MNRKIVVNSNCYHGYSIDEAIEGISNAGFKYIELTATKGWTEHVFFDHSFETLQKVKDKLQDKNLEVIAMSGHTSLMDESRIEDFVKNIHLANFFGARYIVTSVGEAHLEDMANSGNDLIVKHLKSFTTLLRKYDMQLVLEVHGKDHGTGVILQKIIDEVNDQNVRIAYDTANAIFYGDVDPVEDLKESIDAITYVHIKDKAGEKDAWNFPALGEGYVDFKALINVLDTHKNDAPLSIEIEFTEKGPRDLDEVNTALIKSRDYLENLGLKVR
ncbi:MAG: sugar phosphate isomerase/epimerase [Erysipelothrix sp.]|nr:sugar phosphate isomerase/epimerase [Erysipelothrix sp.]